MRTGIEEQVRSKRKIEFSQITIMGKRSVSECRCCVTGLELTTPGWQRLQQRLTHSIATLHTFISSAGLSLTGWIMQFWFDGVRYLVGHLWTSSGCLWPPDHFTRGCLRAKQLSTCTLIWGRFWPHFAGPLGFSVLLQADGEFFNYINILLVSFSWTIYRGPWMCKLRCHLHSPVATGRYRSLLVQRLWIVPQDEWAEQTPYQAQKTTGESYF